jgi:hypothetical protein
MYFERKVNLYFLVIGFLSLCAVSGFIFIKDNPLKGKYPPKVLGANLALMPTAIDPNFITQVNECFIPVASLYGYDLRITSGFRNLAEQDQAYQQGRTVDGHIITEAPAGKSIHNYGFAVDVVDRQNGYDIDWAKLGKIGSYCGLEQGPDGDFPHFEHRGGLTTADFAAGLRPSPLTLPCIIMDILAKTNKPLTLSGLKACGTPKF